MQWGLRMRAWGVCPGKPGLGQFIQSLPDPDLRAHLSAWCLTTMNEVADTAAHFGGSEALGMWG